MSYNEWYDFGGKRSKVKVTGSQSAKGDRVAGVSLYLYWVQPLVTISGWQNISKFHCAEHTYRLDMKELSSSALIWPDFKKTWSHKSLGAVVKFCPATSKSARHLHVDLVWLSVERKGMTNVHDWLQPTSANSVVKGVDIRWRCCCWVKQRTENAILYDRNLRRPHRHLFYYVILRAVKTAAFVCPLSKLAGTCHTLPSPSWRLTYRNVSPPDGNSQNMFLRTLICISSIGARLVISASFRCVPVWT